MLHVCSCVSAFLGCEGFYTIVLVVPPIHGPLRLGEKHLSVSPYACSKQRVHVRIVANASQRLNHKGEAQIIEVDDKK